MLLNPLSILFNQLLVVDIDKRIIIFFVIFTVLSWSAEILNIFIFTAYPCLIHDSPANISNPCISFQDRVGLHLSYEVYAEIISSTCI